MELILIGITILVSVLVLEYIFGYNKKELQSIGKDERIRQLS